MPYITIGGKPLCQCNTGYTHGGIIDKIMCAPHSKAKAVEVLHELRRKGYKNIDLVNGVCPHSDHKLENWKISDLLALLEN